MKISIELLKSDDVAPLVDSFKKIGWEKSTDLFKQYLRQQKNCERNTYVAKIENAICGYVTIIWNSKYPSFSTSKIPEISDLNVLPSFRNQGIGTRLIETCENIAIEKNCRQIGLGVGLITNYGAAQRLYVKLGFIPDGKAIFYNYKPVEYRSDVNADDNLTFFLTKKLVQFSRNFIFENNKLVFTQASSEDLNQIIMLMEQDMLGSKRETHSAETYELYQNAFSRIHSATDTHIVVCKREDEIVAVAQIYLLSHITYHGGLRAQIEGVRVKKAYRSKGLGTEFFNYLIELAKNRNCHMVQLTTNKERSEAYRFYEKIGFSNTHDGFKLLLK